MPRVLIVDDHVENGRPLVRLFRFVGIDASHAESGPAGLATLSERPSDVVLLDVMMPDMDGFEVLRTIRTDPRFDAVIVLMYTAAADAESRSKAAGLGAQGYIVKGTSFDTLRAEVERHLAERH